MATPKPSPPGKKPSSFKIDGHAPDQKNREALAAAAAELRDLRRQNRILAEELAAERQPPRLVRPASVPRPSPSDRIRVIIADNHGSVMDAPACAAVVADLKHLRPHEIVHLGDGVDCGGFLAQHHVMGFVAETEYSYTDDIANANRFLDDVQNAAGAAEFDYIEGNHERRVETWCVTQTLRHQKDCETLRKALAPEYMLQLKKRGIRYIRQSEHYGCRTPGTIRKGKCFFWHGSSTAKHAATVNLGQIGGNVVFGHTHRQQGESAAPVAQGEIGAWNPGCLCRQQPLWQHTRPTNWTTGYAVQIISRAGHFLHINIRIVDGVSLLRPLLAKHGK